MPGQFRHSLAALPSLAKQVEDSGVPSVLVFGIPSTKDDRATSAIRKDGVVQQAIKAIKHASPSIVVMTDVCICAYTPHGHCGVLRDQAIDNDATLPLLSAMAVSHAEAGADVVAPSSMMDGQVSALRCALMQSGMDETAIMGYSAKFASGFYGPFREAADSAPSFGDRASYQHDPANIRHARREILQDVEEGADILMVKPGLAYLDVVRMAREISDLPLAAYSVSGEYSMTKAAAERGWLDEKRIALETLTAFRRAGADLIITYYALEAANWLKDS
jgi:porphobilinogen synthase